MLSSIIAVLGGVAVLLLVGVIAILIFVPAKKKDASTGGKDLAETAAEERVAATSNAQEAAASEVATAGSSQLRRRSSAAAPTVVTTDSSNGVTESRRGSVQPAAPTGIVEARRGSFQQMTATNTISPEGRRASFQTALPSSTESARRASFTTTPQQQSQQQTPQPSESVSPSTPISPRLRKQSSATGKAVSFSTADPASNSPASASSPSTTSTGFPSLTSFEDIEGHIDAVESAAFSEDGLLATGGGPEDVFIRIYNRGVGTVGPVRHNINVQRDCGKHDGPSFLNFAVDEGKKSTLLLVGTRSERFLMGYKISRAASTHPLLVFTFPTNHASPLTGAVGFIPKEATNYFEPGVWLATCAKGTREVKIWSPKGVSLFVIDCECWTMGLRVSLDGKHLAVLSSGGGPGVIFDVKKDKHHHLKFTKTKLTIPIDASSTTASPHVMARRSIMGDVVFQAAQDLVFHPGGAATSVCCRVDVAISVASVASVDSATQWELEAFLKPESLLTSSPTHLTVLIPKSEGRNMRVVVSRGKNVYFFDGALSLIGVLEGRREDGDVLTVALSPKNDFVVVCAFGGSAARLVNLS